MVRDMAKETNRGDGADVVFEASGSPSAIPEGLQLVRTLGTYIVPGQYSNSGGIEIEPQMITFKAIRIVGSSQYKISDIATYLDFLLKHADLQDKFAACITHRYSIAEANDACSAASSGESVKAVFHAD
jgi:L-iditol 2-dehydrogenase